MCKIIILAVAKTRRATARTRTRRRGRPLRIAGHPRVQGAFLLSSPRPKSQRICPKMLGPLSSLCPKLQLMGVLVFLRLPALR